MLYLISENEKTKNCALSVTWPVEIQCDSGYEQKFGRASWYCYAARRSVQFRLHVSTSTPFSVTHPGQFTNFRIQVLWRVTDSSCQGSTSNDWFIIWWPLWLSVILWAGRADCALRALSLSTSPTYCVQPSGVGVGHSSRQTEINPINSLFKLHPRRLWDIVPSAMLRVVRISAMS